MTIFNKALLVAAALLFAVPAIEAADDKASAPTLINARMEAHPGRTTEMYRVPGGMELLITQACVPHPAMQVELGRERQELTFRGTGCTEFGPGMRIGGGETIYCANRSGLARNCMVIGMLQDDPNRGGGAELIDVDEALAEEDE